MKRFVIPTLILAGSALFAAAQDAVNLTPSPSPSRGAEAERVIVTAGAIEHSETDSIESVSSLSQQNLKRQAAATLGDTLRNEPGVAASGFSAGASRPVIRGLADNRVRVLNNGTEVFDVSSLSPDHAPSVSPLLSSSIEVVRGPASILYGSGAIGGVVNVIDTRIPVEAPSTPFSGEMGGRFGSVDLERSGAISLQLATSPHFVWHADASILRTDDRGIPGFALSERIRAQLPPGQRDGRGFGENPKGEVPNTYVRTKDFGFGGSYVWEKGYIGASFSEFLSTYGIPADPLATAAGEEQLPVHLDIEKRQFNLRSSIVDPVRGIHNANLKVVYTDYEHREIEKNAVAATFQTDGIDGRIEIVHEPIGLFQGSFGGQVLTKNLSILGNEAFLQPTETLQLAAFIFEGLKLGPWQLQGGARVEYDAVEIVTDDPLLTPLTSASQKTPDFLPVSVAGGAVYEFAPGYTAALNLTFSQRAPTAEELFARGPHEATFQFIVGDPNLELETSRGVEINVGKKSGVVTGSVSAFYNRFSDFIAFTPTGEFEDGLQVFNYTATNAEFFGGEAQVQFHLLPLNIAPDENSIDHDSKTVRSAITGETPEPQRNPHDLFLDFRADYVRAEESDTGEPLPRITPFRYGASLNYRSEKWEAKIEGQRVSQQNRTAQFETSTDGYTFLNASAGYNFRAGPALVNVYVRGTNLLNEEARDHLSFLKDALPLAGRSVLIGVRTTF